MAIAMQGVTLYAANAATDFTGKLFFFTKIDTNGNLAIAAAGDPAIGTVVEEATAGLPASAQLDGIAKVSAGAAVAAGSRVQADANGQAIVLGAGAPLGVALNAATAANQIISIKLF